MRHRPAQGRDRHAPRPGRRHGHRSGQQRRRRVGRRTPAASPAPSPSVPPTTPTASRPFSNRGTMLDVLAPGTSITSSVPDDSWATYRRHLDGHPPRGGRPRPAAPARADPADREPGRGPADQLAARSSTRPAAVSVTTRRIDVLNALLPRTTLTAAPATAPEGASVTAGGFWSSTGGAVTVTASAGTVTQGVGTWSWTATRGDDTTLPVTITATDAGGASRSVTFTARWADVSADGGAEPRPGRRPGRAPR